MNNFDINNIINTPDHTSEFDYDDVQNTNVVITALTYILFFIPYIFAPNSQYAKFHANQSLVYLITVIILNVVSAILGSVLGLVPFIGGVVASIISILVYAINIALFVLGLINAFNKQAKELPIIGGFNILK